MPRTWSLQITAIVVIGSGHIVLRYLRSLLNVEEVSPMTVIWILLAAAICIAVVCLAASARVVQQFERGVVFRFGRVYSQTRAPGLSFIAPFVDRMEKVNMQIITMPVPAQDGITRDNVTVRVDAVVYFRVVDPVAGGGGRPGLRIGDWPGRPDVAALDHREEHARRPAVRPGATEPGSGADDRQPGCRLGRAHRPGRDQGRRPARVDEAVDVAPGRGRARTSRPGDHPPTESCRPRESWPRPPA